MSSPSSLRCGDTSPSIPQHQHKLQSAAGWIRLPAVKGLRAAVICLGGLLTAALFIIPPWQNPDEPQHVQTVRLILKYGEYIPEAALSDPGERFMIRSMAAARFWEHYGEVPPQPLPTRFAAGIAGLRDHYTGGVVGGSRLYYGTVAALFRAAGLTDERSVLPQLYVMRLLSALSALLTAICVWLGTRLLTDSRSATVVTALLALHPQFILVSTSASADALVNLAGGLFWWRAAAVLTSVPTATNIGLMWGAAAVAFLVRRMGAPLLIIAACVTGAALVVALTRRRWGLAAAGIVALVVASAVRPLWTALPANVHQAWTATYFPWDAALVGLATRSDQISGVLETVFRSFWLTAGWMRYSAPLWWQAVTVFVTAVSSAGLLLGWRRRERAAYWLGLTMVAVQLVVIVTFSVGRAQAEGQGRYLFPVLPATLVLIWIGWSTVLGSSRQPFAAVSLIALMAFLNFTAWTVVILPAYA